MSTGFKSRMAARKRGMKDSMNKVGSHGSRVPKGEHCPTGKMGRAMMHGRSKGGAR